ncbi:reverse transcriptase domain-containing protein, partial [Tanacetum coccineum]
QIDVFPFSLEGAARIWLEKEPSRSIHTWEDLVSKFVNYFFPPSKTTNLKNDITNFQQRFDETFSEAWDRFKDLLCKCPHHGFLELHQIDTLYNALTQSNQDSLNAAAGGNLLNRTPRDALTIIENKSKVRISRNKLIVSKVSTTTSSPSPSPDITALTEIIKELCLATDGNTFDACVAVGTYNQGGNGYRPQGDPNYRASNQMGPPGFPPPNVQNSQNYNQNRYNQNQGNYQAPNNHGFNQQRGQNFNQRNNNYQAPNNQAQVGPSNELSNYMKSNEATLRAMQTQMSNINGVSYDGPTIPPTPSPLPKEVEREPEATNYKVQTTNLGSTAHVQPPVVQVPIPEPDVAPKPNPKPSIPYPLRLNDQKIREKANNQMLKFLQIFQRLHFDLSFADALFTCLMLLKKLPKKLGDSSKFLIPCDFLELDECLALADLGTSINLMPFSVWKKLSLPALTPTRMTLELANRLVAYPVGVSEDVFVKVGKFHFPADFVVVDYDVDPRVPLILGRPFLRTARALIDVHGEELTLRVNDEAITFNVGHTSRYSYRYDDGSVNRIDGINVTCEEYAQEVLGFSDSYKSGNLTPSLDPIITTSSPSLTPFEGGDFVLEKIEACLTSDSIPPGINDADFDPEGDILLLEKLLNDDPSSPLPQKELNFEELKIIKSSVDDPSGLELKDLPSHLEYAFLEDTNKLPIIIAKNLKDDEKARLLKVLKSHKRAIGH